MITFASQWTMKPIELICKINLISVQPLPSFGARLLSVGLPGIRLRLFRFQALF